MHITRFAQSCLLIETKGKRILIDPGFIQYQESYLQKEWSDIDTILVTHKHADHCHVDAIKEIAKNPKTKFYTSQEVANAYSELSPNIVKAGDVLDFNDVKVEVVRAVHGWTPLLKGREVNENIGYIVDDGSHRIYQTSDTLCFENEYKCDVIFLPVNNHGLVMSPWEAALFAKESEAKLVVPIHYDNLKFPADIPLVKKEFEAAGLNYRFLEIGERLEL
ncbi:MBL fold metallo-hydrolase [Candidatus Uhrbacteria bacterium]|nr:MBL fold metallo-hydrolase [Candidatus Uhrbacteria bacterium]